MKLSALSFCLVSAVLIAHGAESAKPVVPEKPVGARPASPEQTLSPKMQTLFASLRQDENFLKFDTWTQLTTLPENLVKEGGYEVAHYANHLVVLDGYHYTFYLKDSHVIVVRVGGLAGTQSIFEKQITAAVPAPTATAPESTPVAPSATKA